jgi:hypothetical protein
MVRQELESNPVLEEEVPEEETVDEEQEEEAEGELEELRQLEEDWGTFSAEGAQNRDSEAEVRRRHFLEGVAPAETLSQHLEQQIGRLALDPVLRREVFGGKLPEEQTQPTRRTLGARINDALHDEMLRRREVLVFGEDVGRKGGVYGITQFLQQRFGRARCFDTLLDETTILGVAQGAAQLGLLPAAGQSSAEPG